MPEPSTTSSSRWRPVPRRPSTRRFGWSFTDFGPDYTAIGDAGLDGGSSAPRRRLDPLVSSRPTTSRTPARSRPTVGDHVPIFEFPGGRRFHFRDPPATSSASGRVMEARASATSPGGDAHALDDHLDAMTGTGCRPGAAEPAPGWTRGHVLTHIARNADSFVRRPRGGRGAARSSPSTQGVSTAATPTSRRARPATGPPSSTTFESSAARLEEVFAGQDRWDLAMTNSQGESVPHADLPFRRLREVLVHHADLGDDGFTPADWPADYVREELRRMEMLYNARQPMGVTGPARGGQSRRSAGAAVLAARPWRHRGPAASRHLLAATALGRSLCGRRRPESRQ